MNTRKTFHILILLWVIYKYIGAKLTVDFFFHLKNQNNKDDNIHKSEALKRCDRQTLTIVECQN